MSVRFSNATALVTGGGSGIGRAVALALAAEGAAIVVAGRTPGPLHATVELIARAGGRAAAVPADTTSAADMERLVDAAVDAFGSLDVAVNNAGVLTATGPVADIDEDQWRTLLDVNVTGVLLGMRAQVAYMRRNGGGAIVNVSSTLGPHVRRPGTGAYGASKAAVSALTRAAAREYIGEGVRINAVSPGPSATAMSLLPGETEAGRTARMRERLPIGRVGKVEEIAAAVLYLAAPESAFTVGADLVVDGGNAA
jgi:NAD(P)-dependent dehydrogenase (short-subunit alcohol dehydrogenase family)